MFNKSNGLSLCTLDLDVMSFLLGMRIITYPVMYFALTTDRV